MSDLELHVQKIKSSLTVSTVVGKYIKLTKKGGNYWGCCPFHGEKTPSFAVNDSKGFYHCFGCGVHGNVVDFVINHDKLEFIPAIEKLSAFLGTSMPEFKGGNLEARKINRVKLNALELASDIFHKNLFLPIGKQALEYVINRGITKATIEKFKLGFSVDSFSALSNHLKGQNFSIEDLIDTGLVIKNDTGKVYDRFRNRLMFTIFDRQSRPVAFGGRTINKNEDPKYLNSPESKFFHKGNTLYAFNFAKNEINKQNSVIVVEGYMDVLSLHQNNFTNTIAPMGTALTEEQIEILWKNCDKIYLCFDGDNAGYHAGVRALERSLTKISAGKQIYFIQLPENEDPDSVIQKKSASYFKELLDNGIPFSQFIWNHLSNNMAFKSTEDYALLEKKLQDFCSVINDPILKKHLNYEYNGKIFTLKNSLRKNRSIDKTKSSIETKDINISQIKQSTKVKLDTLEKELLMILYLHPKIFYDIEQEIISTKFISNDNDECRLEVIEQVEQNSLTFMAKNISDWEMTWKIAPIKNLLNPKQTWLDTFYRYLSILKK